MDQRSRVKKLSSGWHSLSYTLTLTFPTWGALLATIWILVQHRTVLMKYPGWWRLAARLRG